MERLTQWFESSESDREAGVAEHLAGKYTWEELMALALARLAHYEDLEEQGRLVVLDEQTALAMCAGARAIERSKRFQGTTYCWDVFGKYGGPKELSYYEAANKLRCLAERALEGGQST